MFSGITGLDKFAKQARKTAVLALAPIGSIEEVLIHKGTHPARSVWYAIPPVMLPVAVNALEFGSFAQTKREHQHRERRETWVTRRFDIADATR